MSATIQGEKKSFFGFFKNIFWKSAPPVAADDEMRIIGATPGAPVETESGHNQATAVPVARLVPTPMPAPTTPTGVVLPLQSVIASFPVELRSQIAASNVADFNITIPFDKILSQLASGLVRIPFSEVRRAAPEAFKSGVEGDAVLITLPLNEILSRINPTLLMRRPTQRHVTEIPDEIASPFDGKNFGSLSVGNAKPAAPSSARAAAHVPVARPPAPAPVPTDVAMSFPPPTPRPATPVTPIAPAAPAATVRPPSPKLSALAAELESIPSPFASAAPSPIAPGPSLAAPTPPIKFAVSPAAPAPVPVATQPATAPAAPQPASKNDSLFLAASLKALNETWPDALRQEIVQQNLAEAKLALPADSIEPQLRKGRVAFPWKVVRSWIRPATAPMVSVHDAVEVELPLKVLAPLFVSRQRAGKFSASTTNDSAEAIPDVFFGGSVTPPAAIAHSVTPQPAAPAKPLVVPPAIPVGLPVAPANPTSVSSARPADTNYFEKPVNFDSDTTRYHVAELSRTGPTGTEFVTRYATPNEIVSRAAVLEGVAGALIALPDGLMVASRIPSDLNGDTLAAFLPQLFAKMTACTKELRMGELNNLNFTVGNVPWKIFRVNAIFFAAFGRANHALPSAQLAALAGELDRKNK